MLFRDGGHDLDVRLDQRCQAVDGISVAGIGRRGVSRAFEVRGGESDVIGNPLRRLFENEFAERDQAEGGSFSSIRNPFRTATSDIRCFVSSIEKDA